MAKSQTMSIFLLKAGVDFEDALRDPQEMKNKTSLECLGPAANLIGSRLYIADYRARPPWWKDYLSVGRDIRLEAKGAILFLSSAGRNFAVTYGHVAHYLKDWKYEYDFGLLATLNSIDPLALRSADVLRPENARRQRIQASKSSEIAAFGINFDETVVKRLTGDVREEWRDVFSHVTGANNVRVTTKVDLEELPDLCESLLHLYESDEYKSAFPDLRNVAPVHDPEIISELDGKLLKALHARDGLMILSFPDVVDYQAVQRMKISNGVAYPLFIIDSVWENYGSRLKSITIVDLKSNHVSLLDENGQTCFSSSLYRCLVWDCVIDGVQYHFCEGSWYKIDSNFFRKLTEDLDRLFVHSDLPSNSVGVEGDYNKYVPTVDSRYICMDRANIAPSGNVEPCDLFSVVGECAELVHVKIGVHSEKLSHLFNQGLTSVSLLLRQQQSCATMKQYVCDHIGKNNVQRYCVPIDKKKFKVVYAIITKKPESQKSSALPLFSRITLRSMATRLRDMGVAVEVKMVRDDAESRRTRE